ncbi:hypothetical protein M6B38_275845 [Iris pallida]|uniref:Uncharacterized protein n=1 Tax=Iris pallida TaxID=29817 RepID=A0AAX6I666_IRIPA|nr:hypothetical protein M6B38_275845 [Iris pallida]
MTLASTYILLPMDCYLSLNADINNLTLTTKKDVMRRCSKASIPRHQNIQRSDCEAMLKGKCHCCFLCMNFLRGLLWLFFMSVPSDKSCWG